MPQSSMTLSVGDKKLFRFQTDQALAINQHFDHVGLGEKFITLDSTPKVRRNLVKANSSRLQNSLADNLVVNHDTISKGERNV